MRNMPDAQNSSIPFTGYVETTIDALRLIHAARQGVIPRITRRLNDTEKRTMIKSGSVFIFSVEESGIKRWTDGLLWSPSRIVGNFLVYREINERANSRNGPKNVPPYPLDSPSSIGQTNYSPPGGGNYETFKTNGLTKKTITVTIAGSDLHLISYYTPEDIHSGRLMRPSTRIDITSLHMPPHIFRLTNFRVPPKVEVGPDGEQRFVIDPEDTEHVKPKVEEHTYSLTPHSPQSPSSPTTPESPFSGHLYMSTGARSPPIRTIANRWSSSASGATSISRPASPGVRNDYAWVSPTTPQASLPRTLRGESDSTWNAMPTQRYETASSRIYEQPRNRTMGLPYPGQTRHNGRQRDGSAHRLPWLLNDTSNVDTREVRSASGRPSTTYSPVPQYSSSYAGASGWDSPANSGALGVESPASSTYNHHGYSTHGLPFATQASDSYDG